MSIRLRLALMPFFGAYCLSFGIFQSTPGAAWRFGEILVGIGVLLNYAVLQANGNRMPVRCCEDECVRGPLHLPFKGRAVRLWWLADIWDWGPRIYSVGDIAIVMGVLLVLVAFVEKGILK